MRRRVVITGIGTASVCGFGKAAFWNGILKGDTHFQKVNDAFYGADFQGQYGFLDREEQSLFEAQYLSEEERKSLHPCARLALAVAPSAAEDAGLKKFDGEISPERVGVSVGTTTARLTSWRVCGSGKWAVPMEQIKDSIHHIDIAAAIARRMKAAGMLCSIRTPVRPATWRPPTVFKRSGGASGQGAGGWCRCILKVDRRWIYLHPRFDL
ncbi:MAG: beta-ketoacyl synthase N-terminal-like domain-containing protein [Bianqueaceae bacterium]